MKRILKFKINEKYNNRPIIDVLENKFRMSSGLITALKKEADGIMVDGVHKTVRYVLSSGEELVITITEKGSENIEPKYAPLDIIFEDEDLLAINKPADMPTHTSIGHHTDTLANAVLYYLNQTGEEHTFHAVTRLDKDTSGVVLIAKNRYAHDLLGRLIRLDKIQKTYIAAVCGVLCGSGEINAPIKRECDSIIKRTVSPDGQSALTLFSAISHTDKYSLVELCLKTGRTHQIRVHMSHIGHPLAGDTMYGGDDSAKRQLLHCKALKFTHPITGEDIEITAPLPEDFSNFIKTNHL